MNAAELRKLKGQVNHLSYEELKKLAMALIEQSEEDRNRLNENERIQSEMTVQFKKLQNDCDALKKENENQKRMIESLSEQLELRKNDLFGCSSEKMSSLSSNATDIESPTDDLAQEPTQNNKKADEKTTNADTASMSSSSKEKSTSGTSMRGKGKKKAGQRKKLLENLPKVVSYNINPEVYDKEYGPGNWRVYSWNESYTVEVVKQMTYVKYVLTPILSYGLEHSLSRIPVDKLLPKSFVSPSLAAYIMDNKYTLGLPIYRQEQDFARNGFPLQRQLMDNWIIHFSQVLFFPVYDYLCQQLRVQKYQHCDETYTTVINDGRSAGTKSFMWAHCSSELSADVRIIVFGYEPTRATEHLRLFYMKSMDPETVIHISADAYVSYAVLEKEAEGRIIISGCMMHCRRRFAEAEKILGSSKMSADEFETRPEHKALVMIGEIYAADEPLKDVSKEERKERRNSEVRPKVDAFFSFIHGLDPNSPEITERMRKAIEYTLNQEVYLRRFLEDPEIPIDNGEIERHIKPYACGRRAWLFSFSPEGADSNAIMYSLVETAKANGANTYTYLKYLLTVMPENIERPASDREYLKDIMPWSEAYRKYEADEMSKRLGALAGQSETALPDVKAMQKESRQRRIRSIA